MIFPKQGHYANDPDIMAAYLAADLQPGKIGDLLNYDLAGLLQKEWLLSRLSTFQSLPQAVALRNSAGVFDNLRIAA
jgi:hypothetical protein